MRTVAFFLALVFTLGAAAQDKKGQDAALRRLNAQIQRLAADKARLERDKEEAARALSTAQEELQKQRSAALRNAKEARRLDDEVQDLELELASALTDGEELRQRLVETESALAGSRAEGESLRKRVANQAGTIGFWQAKTDACQAKNGALAKLGYELAERYRAKTCDDAALDNEPFTGIARTRMENLLEDYKDQLRANRFDPRDETAKEVAK